MATKKPDIWQELNERQQHYLKAIYTIDQQTEQAHKSDGLRWMKSQRKPASVWRWIPYHPRGLSDETLLQREIGRWFIDEGTGSTFEALEQRGLIECRHTSDGALSVKMTPAGRKLIRAQLPASEQPPKKQKGVLSRWNWTALKRAYDAMPDGLESESTFSDYGGTNWYPTWGEFQRRGWIIEDNHRLKLTRVGRELYESRLTLHKETYPDLYP